MPDIVNDLLKDATNAELEEKNSDSSKKVSEADSKDKSEAPKVEEAKSEFTKETIEISDTKSEQNNSSGNESLSDKDNSSNSKTTNMNTKGSKNNKGTSDNSAGTKLKRGTSMSDNETVKQNNNDNAVKVAEVSTFTTKDSPGVSEYIIINGRPYPSSVDVDGEVYNLVAKGRLEHIYLTPSVADEVKKGLPKGIYIMPARKKAIKK